jgi:MoaA/NifB/PqqE/SkfB family radical SAM enzyme
MGGENGKSYDAAIHWQVTQTCNLSCYQCNGAAVPLQGDYAPEIINLEALKRYLDVSGKTFKFIFTGGEPLCVRNIIETFCELSNKHYLAIITNLTSPKVKEVAKLIDPKRVLFIAASAHIAELKRRNLIDAFIENCVLLKDKNFNLHVREVAYPFIENKINDYKKYFKRHGIELMYQAFRGTWKGMTYPQAYTKKQIKKYGLNKINSHRHDIFSHKNKLCNAGYNTVVVLPDGRVTPCFSLQKDIGNIRENIKFYKKLIKCPLDRCDCPFPEHEKYLFQKALNENNRLI